MATKCIGWRRWWQAAAVAAATTVGAAAHAHELACDKTIDGEPIKVVSQYPAVITYRLTIHNTHPSADSTVMSARDAMLEPYGFHFTPAPPFDIPVGGKASTEFAVTVHSQDECLQMAAAQNGDTAPTAPATAIDTVKPIGRLDNTFRVAWDLGTAECRARLVCMPPTVYVPPDKNPNSNPPPIIIPTPDKPPHNYVPPGGGPGGCALTDIDGGCNPEGNIIIGRNAGHYQTHVPAISACMTALPVDAGLTTVSTVSGAMGLLWGTPAAFGDGSPRSDLDAARLALGRQTLVATCNLRLFGGNAASLALIAQARAAARTNDCKSMRGLAASLEALNDAGTVHALPQHYRPGLATPVAARAVAADPTTPSHEVCR